MACRPTFGTVVLWCLLAVFFVSSLVLWVGVPDMYNSPDERAAAEVISEFVRENKFTLDETENLALGGVLSPRSMVAVGDYLALITFPGLPLVYGWIGKLVSFPLTKLITPLLAVLAVLAWKKTLEVFLSRRAALTGSILFLFLAGFWFYTARAFMHNVPFLSLCVFGVYFLASKPCSRVRSSMISFDVALAGLMFGLALLFRASEILWMAIAGVVFFVFFSRALDWKKALLFLAAIMLGFAPFFFWNAYMFRDPLQIGYTVSSPIFSVSEITDSISSIVRLPEASSNLFSRILFPFGFHPRLAWNNFVAYQLELTWWMTLLAICGLPFLLYPKKRDAIQTRALRAVLVATLFAGGYLTFLYGSWKIVDNPDPWSVTLANSYVRYWLPIYLAGTIPSALFIEWLSKKTRTLFAQRAVIGVILLTVGVLSARLVFFHPDDGLMKTRQVLGESITIRDEIVSSTEENSVVVVDRADKILFPLRRVVTPLRSEQTYDALPKLLSRHPLYYYGITLPESDLDYLRRVILAPRGIDMVPVKTIMIETLYKFSFTDTAL